MCKKNDKSGVYEINGRVIDIFGLTDEEFDQARKTMTREDFIEYAVDIQIAFNRAVKDGLFEVYGGAVELPEDELRQELYESEVSSYDALMARRKTRVDSEKGFLAVDPGADRERWLLEKSRRFGG